MAKSKQTFNKKEREKKRLKKRKEKLEQRQQRKLEKENAPKKTFEEMLSYVDEDGNVTSTPPDPNKKKKVIKLEDIIIGATPIVEDPNQGIRKGKVKFFNDEKGYGFIIDDETKESIFVHINSLEAEVSENTKVIFEVEMGPKGPNAVNVKLA